MEQYANRLQAAQPGSLRYALSGEGLEMNKQLFNRLTEVSGWGFSHPLLDLLHLKRVFWFARETRRCTPLVRLCGGSVMQLIAPISLAFDGRSRRCRWNVDAAPNTTFDAHVSGDTLAFAL